MGISIGNHPAFLFAAAVSCEIGKSELEIANALREMAFVKCGGNDSMVPAECELVLEGTITDELVDEGPFPDITGAYDIVRKQRVIKINRISHRRDPIYQAVLPGASEHRMLMGMPREATMFREINKVCTCLDVRLTAGGSSWLHAVIRIRKERGDGEGTSAGSGVQGSSEPETRGPVVDDDVDLDDPNAVEWAISTEGPVRQGPPPEAQRVRLVARPLSRPGHEEDLQGRPGCHAPAGSAEGPLRKGQDPSRRRDEGGRLPVDDQQMHLTPEEKDMLAGKQGHATKKSMEILVALGEIYGAKRLVPVSSVQVSGVSYKNLGDAGIEFLSELAEDGRARVKTTLNPAGMDLENWRLQGIDPGFASKQ